MITRTTITWKEALERFGFFAAYAKDVTPHYLEIHDYSADGNLEIFQIRG